MSRLMTAALPASNYTRLRGSVRKFLAAEIANDYLEGASIRQLADRHRLSYGTVRALLLEAHTTLRGRGGPRHRRKGPAA